MAASPLSRVVDYLRMCVGHPQAGGVTDEQLLWRFVRLQDESAFEALVRRHAALVWTVCRRVLTSEHDVEDAFQATFLVLVRKAPSIRKRLTVAPWLHGVAYRIALKARAKGQRQGFQQLADVPHAQPDAHSEASGQEVQAIIDEEIARLPERFRAPLVLCGMAGKSKAEAAIQLGVNEGTLSSRLDRARQRLRGRLARRGVLVAAGTAGLELLNQPALALSATVVAATVRMAKLVMAGEAAAASGISKSALALAESFLHAAMLSKMKAGLVLAVLLCGIVVGGGWAAHQVWIRGADPAKAGHDQNAMVAAKTRPVVKPQPNEANARLDLHGDPLPDGAVARLGTLRWRHAGKTTFAAFLPDGKAVLSADVENSGFPSPGASIRIWEYPSGKELRRISAAVDPPLQGFGGRSAAMHGPPLAISQDGKTLAAWFGKEVRILDAATGKQLQTLNLGALKLALSPDGKQLAVLQIGAGEKGVPATDYRISIWDWAKAKELRTFDSPRGSGSDPMPYDNLLWSPDGTTLATSKTELVNKEPQTIVGFIQFWDPATGKGLKTIAIPDVTIWPPRLVFSPDSKMLALPTLRPTDSIVVVDIATGTQRACKHEFNTFGPLLLFGRDSTKLYGCGNLAKQIYKDEEKSELIRTDLRKVVVEWDATTGKELRRFEAEMFGTGAAVSAGWSPDGQILVLAGNDNALDLIDVTAGKWIDKGAAWAFSLLTMQFTSDGKHLFSMRDAGIYKWDAVTRKQDGMLFGLFGVSDVASLEGQADWTNTYAMGAALRDAAGKAIGPLPGVIPGGPILFSPDGKKLAARHGSTGAEGQIALYEVPTGKLLHTSAVNNDGLDYFGWGARGGLMFFTPDSKLLGAWVDAKTLGVWNTASGQRIAALIPAVTKRIHSGAFSPDGRCVALDQNNGTVALYELASGQLRRTYGIAGKEVSHWVATNPPPPLKKCVVFGKDGRTMFHAGLDFIVHVWDVASGKEVAAFKGHSAAINALALAPDGKTLVSASDDTTALIWDLSKIGR